MRILICAVLTMAMLLAAPAAMAEPADAPVGMKILDFVLVRPNLGTYMVAVPWRYTSSRHYGNFSEYRDNRTTRGALIADTR